MIKLMYCIHDNKLGVWGPPIVCVNDYDAQRVVDKLVNAPQFNQYSKDPGAFAIYCVGEFCEAPLGIKTLEQPRHVSNFVDIMKPRDESVMLGMLRKFLAQQAESSNSVQ